MADRFATMFSSRSTYLFFGLGCIIMSAEGFISNRDTSVIRLTSLAASATSSSESNGRSGRIRGVVFDIDGTLADSWNLGFEATKTVLAEYQNDMEEVKLSPDTYPLSSEEYHFGCRYTTPERLARHVGLEPGDDAFEETGKLLGDKFDRYYVQLVDTATAGFYDGIGEMLIRLHAGELKGQKLGSGISTDGVKLGALTNACVEYAHAVLKANCPQHSSEASSLDAEKASIYSKFVSIHGANSVPRPKPFGDGILKCCQEMGVTPDQVIYVGDAPTDAQAAVDAKCRAAIGVLWGSNNEEVLKNEEGFDTLCKTTEELSIAIAKYL